MSFALQEVKCILADGKDLGVRIGMLERLKSATSAIESWLSSINLVIPASGSKSKCTEGQLEHFLSEVEVLLSLHECQFSSSSLCFS